MTAAGHHPHCAARILRSFYKLMSRDLQLIPSHHARIQPVELPSLLSSADDSDVRPVDLGPDLGNKVFLQPEHIGHFAGRLHSNCKFMPSHHSTLITRVNESINARVLPTCKQILVTFRMSKTATARTGSTSA